MIYSEASMEEEPETPRKKLKSSPDTAAGTGPSASGAAEASDSMATADSADETLDQCIKKRRTSSGPASDAGENDVEGTGEDADQNADDGKDGKGNGNGNTVGIVPRKRERGETGDASKSTRLRTEDERDLGASTRASATKEEEGEEEEEEWPSPEERNHGFHGIGFHRR